MTNQFAVSGANVVNINVNEQGKVSSQHDAIKKLTGTVYIVDDDKMIAQIHALLLQSYLGIKVKWFCSPCAVMMEIEQFPDECVGIITDAFMFVKQCPIQTGLELISQLRKVKPVLPVLFVTGLFGDSEKVVMMEEAYYMQKPLEPQLKDYVGIEMSNMSLNLFFSDVIQYDLENINF